MPEKPINAIASSPAHISAIGTPFMDFGRGVILNCSRMPAKIHRASVNPRDVAIP